MIGGLIGAGLASNTGEVYFPKLANAFLLPLLVSPLLAAAFGVLAYRLLRLHRPQDHCACKVMPTAGPDSIASAADTALAYTVSTPSIVLTPLQA